MDRRTNGRALRWGRVEGMQGEDRQTDGSRGGGGWRSGWVGWTDGHVIDGRQRSAMSGMDRRTNGWALRWGGLRGCKERTDGQMGVEAGGEDGDLVGLDGQMDT